MPYRQLCDRVMEIMDQNCIDLHSFVIMHKGAVVAERYRKPFSAGFLHRMYSSTKSFTGIAVLKLVDEGKLRLEDHICDLFADRFDVSQAHPYFRDLTVRDALRMATCYSEQAYSANDRNWLERYFCCKPTHPPGTLYYYDSSGSYMLGALVRHITGMHFLDYLRPILDKIGFSKEARCLKGPDRESWASSALLATTRDLAKFAALLANFGSYNGEQLISESLIRDAIRPQIVNYDDASDTTYAWHRGYGYQIWILRDNAFFLNGAGAQFAIGFPDRELVFACNGDTQGNAAVAKHVIFDTIWKEILPNFPVTRPLPPEEPKPTVQEQVNGVTWKLNENPMGISDVCLTFTENGGMLRWNKSGAEKQIPYGFGEPAYCSFPERYNGDILFSLETLKEYRCAVDAKWTEPHKIMITVRAQDDYFGNLVMVFSFKGTEIGIKMHKNAQFFFDDYQGFAGGYRENEKI